MLKRRHKGTNRKMSKKHLHWYVREFPCRHNARDLDTIEQMGVMDPRMERKRLRYLGLVD